MCAAVFATLLKPAAKVVILMVQLTGLSTVKSVLHALDMDFVVDQRWFRRSPLG